MSGDAPQPPSTFCASLRRAFAALGRAVDDNARAVQYGIYCVGAAGVILVLHSARAFTKFTAIRDIPKEFLTKHVRLPGRVWWVGGTPPSAAPPTPAAALPLSGPSPQTPRAKAEEENGSPPFSDTKENGPPPFSDTKENGPPPFSGTKENGPPPFSGTKENATVSKADSKSLSEHNRGIYEGAGELHPWENGIDPDVSRIQYEEELFPLYLQVEHTPVISLPWRKKSDQLYLPIQLADVEVTRTGLRHTKAQLLGQRTWFTLLSHNTEEHTLVSLVRPAKVFQRMSVNEQLLREGLALVGPMDLELHDDAFYVKLYTKLIQAQEYAEKKQLGIWKVPVKPHRNILGRLWAKLRALVTRKSQ